MNNPFDRHTIRKESAADDSKVNRQFGQADRSLRFLIEHLLAGRASDASPTAQFRTSFLGNSLRVAAVNPAAMQVTVAPGLGFIYDLTDEPTDIDAPDYNGVDDRSPVKPLPLVAPVTFNIPAAPAGPNTRIDIVEVRTDRRHTDADLMNVFDDATESFLPTNVLDTLAFALDGETGSVNAPANSIAGLSYKVGVAANPGVAPATSPGYTKLAEVDVGSAAATITDSNIRDKRVLAGTAGIVRAAISFRLQWTGGAPVVTLDGGCVCPPGVQICAFPDPGGKSQANVYVVGGQFTKASVRATIETPAVGAAAVMIAMVQGNLGTIGTVTAGDQTNMTAANTLPQVKVAQGQQRVFVPLSARWDAAGTVDQANANLEDIRYSVVVDLAYH